MKNRFNHNIRKGQLVNVRHPRGGSYQGKVAEIQTVRHPDADTRRFVRAYGVRVKLENGGSCSLNDCTPA